MTTVCCPSCGHTFEPRLKQRRMADFDHLASVADAYLANVHTGKPSAHVQIEFQTSRRTACRWVRLAREAGLIPTREGASA